MTINEKGIYSITNLINGKIYIGKTEESFKRRWWHHIACLNGNYHNNKHLQSSWNKYGQDNFEFEIIHVYNNEEDLNVVEIEFIEKFDSFNNGYNLTKGGEGNVGMKHTTESKSKIGEKNRLNMTGKKMSEETKLKMSESAKGYIKSEEHRENLSKSLSGIVRSEETKDKCRKANQGSNQPNSKYTEEMIYDIKVKLKNGYTAKQINEEYGISIGYVYSIKGNRRWSHVVVD